MYVLADTSVWVEHFRATDEVLASLLRGDRVRSHPSVRLELMLGGLKPVSEASEALRNIESAPIASLAEIETVIERRELVRSGVGLVDAGLVASALVHGDLKIYTLDRKLAAVCQRHGILYLPPPT